MTSRPRRGRSAWRDPVLIEGRLQYRAWEAQDGSKRSKVDVVAENIQFLGRGDRGSGSGEEPERGPGRSAPPSTQISC